MSTFFELSNLENFYSQNPNSIAFAFLASRYYDAGMVEKALEIADKGVERHPYYAFGHFVLALCQHHLNDFAKAKSHLEISVALNDKNPQAWRLMSEINEKLNLPIVAGDCDLQYFLMDSFAQDAVMRFQKEDMLHFNEYETEDSSSFDTPAFTGDETTLSGPYRSAANDQEKSIDSLFEDSPSENEELDISEKVEEVFKETLGDISIETRLEDRAEPQEAADNTDNSDSFNLLDQENTLDAIDFPDDDPASDSFSFIDEDQTMDEIKRRDDDQTMDNTVSHAASDLSANTADAPADNSEDNTFDGLDLLNLDSIELNDIPDPAPPADQTNTEPDLDDFFSKYQIEEKTDDFDNDADDKTVTPESGSISPEEDAIDFGSYLFDEPEEEADAPPDRMDISMDSFEAHLQAAADKEQSEPPDNDDHPEIESLVNDIISDDADDSQTVAMNDSQETILATDRPEMPEFISSKSGDDKGAAQFGRPPILSPTLGEIYIAQGRFEEAIEVFQQLLDKDPNNQRFDKKIRDVQSMLEKQKNR